MRSTVVAAALEAEGLSSTPAASSSTPTTDSWLAMQPMLQAMTATGIEILEGYVDGDVVSLRVTLTVRGHKEHGIVEIQRNGGAWRLAKECWG